jgi:stage V sporulation protein T
MTKTIKTTGVVRRIDDLGRIVIPKEIRNSLMIHEGDPLEIFTTEDGELLLKHYFEKPKSINNLLEDFEKLSIENQTEFAIQIFKKFVKKA